MSRYSEDTHYQTHPLVELIPSIDLRLFVSRLLTISPGCSDTRLLLEQGMFDSIMELGGVPGTRVSTLSDSEKCAIYTIHFIRHFK